METTGTYNVEEEDREVLVSNIQDKMDFEISLRKFIAEASQIADGETLVCLSQALTNARKDINLSITQYKYL